MGKIRERRTWHLTPNGWEAGSLHEDIGISIQIKPPANRVLTQTCLKVTYEYHRDGCPYYEVSQPEFQIQDKELIQKLIAKYGDCPEEI
ncbi:hypothetical protein [Nostoc sp. UHCC 0870]|uniref:hypothetical protein n=1 Tax=Nostoc sp. UHCC 0870 TaxID=2914041 RepID=UPI001EDD18D1|nr:hypothetical protein [Nostoc sp. UHCC 0870]UKP01512.1 hypothetical protein L6494_30420 [Nostoc sp. UHCC 0870]